MSKFSSFEEYAKSSVITFVATFSAAVLPSIGDLRFEKSAIVAVVLVGVRAGIKALFELFATVNSTPVPGFDDNSFPPASTA